MAMPCSAQCADPFGGGFDGAMPEMASLGAAAPKAKAKKSVRPERERARRGSPRRGKAMAARVSRGSEVDVWDGLTVKEPQRNPAEHITVTVVIYNTVAGGVPDEVDVAAAIDDMEALYRACHWNGRLTDDGAAFMKAELTVADTASIKSKLAHQPYAPPAMAVANHSAFPMDESDDEAAVETSAALGAPPPYPGEPVHSSVVCDVSGMHPIVGLRFHRKGEDYDLCRAEFDKLPMAEHARYEVIAAPGAAPVDATAWILQTM